jgi:hypothetical protein
VKAEDQSSKHKCDSHDSVSKKSGDFGHNIIIITAGIVLIILAKLSVVCYKIVDQIPLRISKKLFDSFVTHDKRKLSESVAESYRLEIIGITLTESCSDGDRVVDTKLLTIPNSDPERLTSLNVSAR